MSFIGGSFCRNSGASGNFSILELFAEWQTPAGESFFYSSCYFLLSGSTSSEKFGLRLDDGFMCVCVLHLLCISLEESVNSVGITADKVKLLKRFQSYANEKQISPEGSHNQIVISTKISTKT